jgi:hypothetical protein
VRRDARSGVRQPLDLKTENDFAVTWSVLFGGSSLPLENSTRFSTRSRLPSQQAEL